MITGSRLSAADEAAQMVADVRDDPAGRIRLATDTYAVGQGDRRYRPYRRAVVAFMRWQLARGVLNPLNDGVPGSPWWRAVNEDLLRDTLEAKLLIQRGGGHPLRPSVTRWVSFFNAPSAQSSYGRTTRASSPGTWRTWCSLRSRPRREFFLSHEVR